MSPATVEGVKPKIRASSSQSGCSTMGLPMISFCMTSELAVEAGSSDCDENLGEATASLEIGDDNDDFEGNEKIF